MKGNYSHKLMIYVLFVGLFLQSCGDYSNQFIPQEQVLTRNTSELLDNLVIDTNETFVTSGGYLASFYRDEKGLSVDLRADKKQKEPNYLGLPVIIEKGVSLATLAKLDSKTQQNRIQLGYDKDKKIKKLVVFNGGVAGGMKKKNSKNKHKNSGTNNDKIKAALKSKDVHKLDELEKEDNKLTKLFQWKYKKLNVFEYACQYSNLDVIFWIISKIINLEDKKINKLISGKTLLEPIDKENKNCGVIVTPAFKIKTRFESNEKVEDIMKKTALVVLNEFGIDPIAGTSESEKKRNEIIDRMKIGRTADTRSGYYSAYQTIKKRRPREFATFAGEPERQLLKHFSTMLLLQLKRKSNKTNEKSPKCIEIETMHVNYNEKDFLFVAGNEASMTGLFEEVFDKIKSLRCLLEEDFTVSSNTASKKKGSNKKKKKCDTEGNKRVKRYSKYFNKLFNNTEIVDYQQDKQYCENIDEDISYYQAVLTLLRDDTCKILHHSLDYDKANSLQITEDNKQKILNIIDTQGNKIIFVNTSNLKPDNKFKFRHAEEFLTDIAEVIKNKYEEAYTCIAGTKRPCLSCYSRMKFSDKIDKYGDRPGLLFVGRFREQNSINLELAKHTLEEAITQKNYFVTIGISKKNEKMEVPTYDSGTEDEEEG